MGEWAKSLFGREDIGSVGIVFAGSSPKEFEQTVINQFDKVLFERDKITHSYLVEKKRITYPLAFNVYGAPLMVDTLAELYDGGVRNVLFVGYAYGGFKNLDIGSVVLTTKAYHFDGIYHPVEPDRESVAPDAQLYTAVKDCLANAGFHLHEGIDISVPAVTFQPKHNNPFYKEIRPSTVQMELASCLSRAQDIGIRAAGVLIISDNRTASIGDSENKRKRTQAKQQVVEELVKNLESFNFPSLPSTFSVDEYLADIIYDPDDENNVYEKK